MPDKPNVTKKLIALYDEDVAYILEVFGPRKLTTIVKNLLHQFVKQHREARAAK